ncbi:hypothetical protein LTR09_002855 [Extremus antarcticus]|uniref:Uncharacterized protein n=1 Tax=Extremus antarcticus TaxID=702011 RepID=A0AAJ0GF75_9PEZI|nr:hypothetical protein LTR09_002855 [Extremus antarcticus]
MDDDGNWDDEDGYWADDELAAAVINSTFGVYYSNGRLKVVRSGLPEEASLPTEITLKRTSRAKPVLALSDISPNLLAISDGPSVHVYDLSRSYLVCTLSGTGRSITAISWVPDELSKLAVGGIDGSLHFWDIRFPRRPYLRLRAREELCRGIAFRSEYANVFASLHQEHVSIWNLASSSARPVGKIQAKPTGFVSVAWRPGDTGCLAATTRDNKLRLYDALSVLSTAKAGTAASPRDRDDCDDYSENELGMDSLTIHQNAKLDLACPCSRLQWISNDLLLMFAEHDGQALVVEYNEDKHVLTGLWSYQLRPSTIALSVHRVHGTACLAALGQQGSHYHDLPTMILNKLHSGEAPPAVAVAAIPVTKKTEPTILATPTNGKGQTISSSFMKPTPISSLQLTSTSFPNTSRQLQHIRRLSKISAAREKLAAIEEPSVSLQTRSTTSSLELPKPDSEHDSPMPFLSPTIPARRSPQTVIAPLGDSSMELPPLPESSFKSTFAPTTLSDGDDDSDDETFVDVLQGSGTFLPGGINVPLPKACGALFAPNGQLLTFFPPKPRPPVARREVPSADEAERHQPKRRTNKAARLFPTFGNLMGERDDCFGDDSDSDISGDHEMESDLKKPFLEFQLPPSSFHSQNSWLARISPNKPSFNIEEVQSKIKIVVHEIDDVSLPLRTERRLADQYRLLRQGEESGAALCEHNANVAEAAALTDVALIWRLLALLLEDVVPLQVLYGANDNESVLIVAQRAISLLQAEGGLELAMHGKHTGLFGHLRWAGDPFGGPWLVRRIFEWAEIRADVQHLACFAAVLAESDRTERSKHRSAEMSFYRMLPTYDLEYFSDIPTTTSMTRPAAPPIPTLRTRRSTNLSSVYESPAKRHHKSPALSRTPSQPTTPYLDSAFTTPPFAFPPLSRHGSRLSTSGSASPEAHRSSFSAAAKYYAQSITDKFASYGTYGTSPPLKKTGMSASPNNNELSTSLPSGSWSKSVSFATSSTIANTARGSLLSRSYEEPNLEDAYDSDKTIEDSSLPHTPKSANGGVMVTHKNQGAFDDEVSGGAKAPLLPDDLASKARLWVQYYADQLRTWNLLVKATELEKMAHVMHDTPGANTEIGGVGPVRKDSVLKLDACSICTTMMESIEQICLACLHTSHLSCLVDYVIAADDDDFTLRVSLLRACICCGRSEDCVTDREAYFQEEAKFYGSSAMESES